MWAEQAVYFDCRLTKTTYLQTNAFLDMARPNSSDVDISFYQAVLVVELYRNILR